LVDEDLAEGRVRLGSQLKQRDCTLHRIGRNGDPSGLHDKFEMLDAKTAKTYLAPTRPFDCLLEVVIIRDAEEKLSRYTHRISNGDSPRALRGARSNDRAQIRKTRMRNPGVRFISFTVSVSLPARLSRAAEVHRLKPADMAKSPDACRETRSTARCVPKYLGKTGLELDFGHRGVIGPAGRS
jgi:hypothetical protein